MKVVIYPTPTSQKYPINALKKLKDVFDVDLTTAKGLFDTIRLTRSLEADVNTEQYLNLSETFIVSEVKSELAEYESINYTEANKWYSELDEHGKNMVSLLLQQNIPSCR